MLPLLTEIKPRRKQLGLTQQQLAAKCGVSQSLITKIESGKLIPSYENAKRIFDTLESLHAEASLKAADIMTRHIISVKTDTKLKHAVYLMQKHSISQLPVIEDNKNLGTICEKNILEILARGVSNPDEAKVADVMEEALPTIRDDTPVSVISTILYHSPAVLVTKKGKICGIITKSNILNSMILKGKKLEK